MILVDSTIWISNLRHDPETQFAPFKNINANDILVGDLILLEVLRGARESDAWRIEKFMRSFNQVRLVDTDIALKAAANYRTLRSRGITIRSSIDMVIGTFCIEHGHALLQNDRDFRRMAEHLGLRLLPL